MQRDPSSGRLDSEKQKKDGGNAATHGETDDENMLPRRDPTPL